MQRDVVHRASAATHPVGFFNRPFGLPFGGHLPRAGPPTPGAVPGFSPPPASARPQNARKDSDREENRPNTKHAQHPA